MSSPAESILDLTTTADNQTASHLIIAIDFGTTFTGVAYYHSRFATRTLDPHQIAEDISVIRRWPNATAQYSEKIPSIIAYNTDPPTWGRQVRPTDQPQVEYFKLGLEPRARQYYHSPDTQAYTLLRNMSSRIRINHKEPVDITADYLTCVCKYVRDVFFRDLLGEHCLENQQTSYVITVPSIWSDYAQNATIIAATRAGIPRDMISLIAEPEAAALYCATISDEVDLHEGDRFLVCDAGGGTVVNANSYTFLSV